MWTPLSSRVLLEVSPLINQRSSLRTVLKGTSFVPQNIFIVNDTIRKNIAFGVSDSEIDDEKINHCIKQVQLDKMLNSLSDVANHPLMERGKNLSGGQIQRIGIARCLYKNSSIIFLDEITSALDPKTEELIMKNIYNLNKTIFIISHNLLALKNCDCVIEIKEDGTNKQWHFNKESSFDELYSLFKKREL